MTWDTAKDEFNFDFSKLCVVVNRVELSKRNVVKIAAKIFDPLGLLADNTAIETYL